MWSRPDGMGPDHNKESTVHIIVLITYCEQLVDIETSLCKKVLFDVGFKCISEFLM